MTKSSVFLNYFNFFYYELGRAKFMGEPTFWKPFTHHFRGPLPIDKDQLSHHRYLLWVVPLMGDHRD